MSDQTDLNVILGHIELHSTYCNGQGWYITANSNTGEPEQQQCQFCDEHPDLQSRLVRALRRAMQCFDDVGKSFGLDPSPIEEEIAAILQPSSEHKEKQDSGQMGSTVGSRQLFPCPFCGRAFAKRARQSDPNGTDSSSATREKSLEELGDVAAKDAEVPEMESNPK